MRQSEIDEIHMRHALALARRGWGNTAPNPAVGCVLARPEPLGIGTVVGRGWTQPGGRPHAETEALRRAGAAARGATAYVTLEPCAHHGQTPPCAEALIAAEVGRVVAAIVDPDKRVGGRGLEILRDAGIAVESGCLEAEARAGNAGFFSRVVAERPSITLKLATSLDGRIALANGESRWITGPEARARSHLLRAQHDGVAVGIGTVRADDPSLDCRLPGLTGQSPWPIVFDTGFRTPCDGRLQARIARGDAGVRIIGSEIEDPNAQDRRAALERLGFRVLMVPPGADGHVDIVAALTALAREGMTRLMVEGGGLLAAALLNADCVDRIEWFRAPIVLGGDARPGIGALCLDELVAARRFSRVAVLPVGQDVLETYVRAS